MSRAKEGPTDRSEDGTPGSDFLQLDIGEAPAGARTDWLAGRLRDAIADGRLPVGGRLPASRVLAAELGVSRGLVTEAYQRLSEDGHVAGRGRAGTVVVAAPLRPRRPASPARPGPAEALPPSHTPELFSPSPGTEVFEALRAAPARIDLSPGLPDLTAFPRTAWLRAERAVLQDLSPSVLGYGDPRGTPALRRAAADWLGRNRGIAADPEEILVVSGTAQALALIAQVLGRDGIGEAAVEDPGSLGVRQQLAARGLRTPPVPVDDEGLRVDALRASGAPAVVLTPAHQFPMGVVLGGARRRELMAWADAGGLIVEDDYDAEHRYDRAPVPALRSMLRERVFYTGSVSKILAPALRVGWLLPPPRYREALVEAKRIADLGSAALPQLVLARLLESGALERHLRALRRRHRVRRDAMTAALGTHLPDTVVHGAAAGLHLTVTFAADTADDTALATAALERGVRVHPLSWHRQRPYRPGLVLGYAANPRALLTEGIATLDRALDRALR